ncbi:MAG TPA: hypothetical protein VM370_05985 [Candidatus Thermoplasmatota archaeon]|nr:hypothetical protein [Candidatus Thermoplasmatota archaeon]
MPVALDHRSDHLLIRLVGPSVLTSVRRSVVVPYSDIQRVDVESPRWPSLLRDWYVGTHLPSLIAHGVFVAWAGGHRRFLHFERDTERVLTSHLVGHPDHQEVGVEVRETDAARDELAKRANVR